MLGAIEVTTGRWVYRLGRRRAAGFIALLQMLTQAFPRAPMIVVICDNDSIHHARAVTSTWQPSPAEAALRRPPDSPHDNPVERVWAGLRNYVANTAVTLARPPPADPCLLPQPLTRPDAGHRRPLDQALAASRLRAELLDAG